MKAFPTILLSLLLLSASGPGEQPASGSAVLGVTLEATPPPLLAEKNTASADLAETSSGLPVEEAAPGSPADLAGLRKGDIIERIDNERVTNRQELQRIIASHQAGDVIRIDFLRYGRSHVALAELAGRTHSANSVNSPSPIGGSGMQKEIPIPKELLMQISQAQSRIREQLLMLPYGMQPRAVIRDMQELKELARVINTGFAGWMNGPACEASLEFSDKEGLIILHGSDNHLSIKTFDASRKRLGDWPVDTEEQQRALPASLLRRIHSLK